MEGDWPSMAMPMGKALRTVKSCVGSLFCRYGTQDSLNPPSCSKKARRPVDAGQGQDGGVGCPRNCSESLIKDIGITGISGNGKSTPEVRRHRA